MGVGELAVVAEEDGLAEVVGQRRDRVGDVVRCGVSLARRRRVRWDSVTIAALAIDLATAKAAALVHDDAVEPGVHRRAVIETPTVTDDANPRVLHRLACEGMVALKEALGRSEEAALVANRERPKRLAVARLDEAAEVAPIEVGRGRLVRDG